MQESNFERHMQQEMDKLRLRPSDAVWQKVEERIREKKRRRVIIIIFLLAGLGLLGYSGFHYMTGKTNPEHLPIAVQQPTDKTIENLQQSNEQPSVSVPQDQSPALEKNKETAKNKTNAGTVPADKNSAGTVNTPAVADPSAEDANNKTEFVKMKPAGNDNKPAQKGNTQQPSIKKRVTTDPGNAIVTADETAGKNRSNTIVPKSPGELKNETGNNVKQQQQKTGIHKEDKQDITILKDRDKIPAGKTTVPADKEAIAKTSMKPANKNIVPVDTDAVATTATKPADEKITPPVGDLTTRVEQKKADSSDTAVAAKTKAEAADDTLAAIVSPVVVRKKKGPKIKWGLELAAGITGKRDEALPFSPAPRADYIYASPPFNSGAVPGGGNGYPAYTASEVKAGPSFRAGVIGKLKVSKKGSLSSGLRYAYMSQKIKVGSKVDSFPSFQNFANSNISGRDVYVGAQQNDYINGYHFIQLPLFYHLQLNNSKKNTFTWDAGVSIGYLFATKSLVYDPSQNGIYYRDNSLFNKMHFNIGTGLSAGFKTRSGREWSIGPEVMFDMSPQMKKKLENTKSYLLSGGLNIKWFFSRNK